METASDHQVMRLIVGVLYDGSAAYLDNVGKLLDRVGAALRPFGEFSSNIGPAGTAFSAEDEPITINYGVKGFSVTHEYPSTVTDVEAIVGPAWKTVSSILGVRTSATRLGVRVLLRWATDSELDAARLLIESGLVQPSRSWADAFGEADTMEAVSVRHRGATRRRCSLSVGSRTRVTRQFPVSWLSDAATQLLSPGIDLDLDMARAPLDGSRFELDHTALRDMLRANWDEAVDVAEAVHRQLGGRSDELDADHH